jgi:hypothetical protein
MGMKESPARKGNAASKGQQQNTDQTDKKIGQWKGGALGDDAGSSDKRKGRTGTAGAVRKVPSKDKPSTPNAAGKTDPV